MFSKDQKSPFDTFPHHILSKTNKNVRRTINQRKKAILTWNTFCISFILHFLDRYNIRRIKIRCYFNSDHFKPASAPP